MATTLWVNLAVENLEKSAAFYKSLGFALNPQFTGDETACLVVDDGAYVMLLRTERLSSWVPGGLCDTSDSNEVVLSLSADGREAVDEMVAKAVAAGGATYSEPHDFGAMYGHGFRDLDGHVWWFYAMDAGAGERG